MSLFVGDYYDVPIHVYNLLYFFFYRATPAFKPCTGFFFLVAYNSNLILNPLVDVA